MGRKSFVDKKRRFDSFWDFPSLIKTRFDIIYGFVGRDVSMKMEGDVLFFYSEKSGLLKTIKYKSMFTIFFWPQNQRDLLLFPFKKNFFLY